MSKPEKTTKNVLIIGGLLADDIAISTENLKPGSSNPVNWQHKLGGVATNVARVVTQQLDVLLIANCGDDESGKTLAQLLDQQQLSTSVKVWSGENSDRYTAVLNPDGELFIGLADARLAEQMQWHHIQQRLPSWRPEAIVLDANLSSSCLKESVAALTSHYGSGVPIYALCVSPAKSIRWLNVAHNVDLLLCNRREAAALTALDWQSDINVLADGLQSKRFSSFVITDASNAVLVQEPQSRSIIPVPAIHIDKNVNGAGDALAGATIIELVYRQSLPQAVRAGGLPAARAVLTGDAESPSI